MAVTVPSRDVRLPAEARAAIENHLTVMIEAYDRPTAVLLHPADYARLAPMLEKWRSGKPLPVETLLTDDDYAVMASEREADLDVGVMEGWS